MKVTFIVYSHTNHTLTLVPYTIKGNKPSIDAWEEAAEDAKIKVAEQADPKLSAWVGKPYKGMYSISSVLKGWVTYEERAPDNLG